MDYRCPNMFLAAGKRALPADLRTVRCRGRAERMAFADSFDVVRFTFLLPDLNS